MAVKLTMLQVIKKGEQDIWKFHSTIGFPTALTHHASGDAPRIMSHEENYDDMGNRSGSIVMWFMMFKCEEDTNDSILRIFDQTECRAAVYEYWGAENQRSGKGPDNSRTNLLEAILAYMGPEHGRGLQQAWKWMSMYTQRHPGLTREQQLAKAITDPSTDIFTNLDNIAEYIMDQFGMRWDIDSCSSFKRIIPDLLHANAPPSYSDICRLTGLSTKNSVKKKLFWKASKKFLDLRVRKRAILRARAKGKQARSQKHKSSECRLPVTPPRHVYEKNAYCQSEDCRNGSVAALQGVLSCDRPPLQQRMTPAATAALSSSAAASWEQPKTNEDSRSFVDGSTEDFRTKTDAFFALLQQKNISDAILRDAIVDFLARWEGKHKATYRELLADSAVAQEANKLLPKDLPLWLWIRRCLHGEIELIERIDLIEEEKCEWLIRLPPKTLLFHQLQCRCNSYKAMAIAF